MNTEASPAPSRLRCRVMFKIDSLTGSSEKQGAASRSWTRKYYRQLCFGKKAAVDRFRYVQKTVNAEKRYVVCAGPFGLSNPTVWSGHSIGLTDPMAKKRRGYSTTDSSRFPSSIPFCVMV
jgi:hypothetical protein